MLGASIQLYGSVHISYNIYLRPRVSQPVISVPCLHLLVVVIHDTVDPS